MQDKEKNLIDGLFQRMKSAEQNTGPRDSEAELIIQDLIQKQPSAPYYMTQSLLIQEAALNQLSKKVQQLQNEVLYLRKNTKLSGKSFLSKLFGYNNKPTTSQTSIDSNPQTSGGYSSNPISPPISNASSRTGSFMSGALQTAAGIAGGMVLGNMLTNMFHHSTPEEIINIIDEPTASITTASDPLLHQDFEKNNPEEMFHNTSEQNFSDSHDSLLDNTSSSDDFSSDDDSFF